MTWISTPRGLYGESGIRTHGTLTSTHAFQACTFGHSVISPRHRMCRGRRRHGWRRRRPRPRTGRGRRSTWMYKRRPSYRMRKPTNNLAERVGFEPTEPQAAQRFSRPPDSTALASLQDPGWVEVGEVHGRTRADPAPRMVRGRRVHGGTSDDPAPRMPKHKVASGSRGRRPVSSCPRGFEPPTFRSAV